MTWPRLPRSNTERQGVVRSSMTPGAGAGRSAIVAPTPSPPPPMKTVEPSYVPLAPWGVEGDATYRSAPWFGVFEDAAAAAAGTGPSMQFGIGGGIVFLEAAEDETRAYVGMQLGSTPTVFIQFGNGRSELSATASSAGVYLTGPTSGVVPQLVVDDGGADSVSYLQLPKCEADPPGAPTNTGRLFTRDNGSGKTQLCARFTTGAVQVIATEP